MWSARAYTMSERAVGKTFVRQFTGCKKRIIVTTFASNVHRIQQVIDAAHACGRKVAVTGRSMENIMKVSTELGYMKVPKSTVVDLNQLKNLPQEQAGHRHHRLPGRGNERPVPHGLLHP